MLSGYLKASGFKNQGARVVNGEQLMHATSGILLGGQRATRPDGVDRGFYFYLRQRRNGNALSWPRR